MLSQKNMNYFHCTNINLEPYKCTQCIYKTSEFVDLKSHVCSRKFSVTRSQLTCPKCSFTTFSTLILLKHIADYCKLAEWFRCTKCSFKTGRRRYLNRHRKNKHTDEKSTHWFQCEHCLFKSRWKDSVKKHTASKHTDQRVFIRCTECPYSSTCKKSVQKHIKSKHSHVTAPKWRECELCPFRTLHSDSLKRHMMGLHRDASEIDWHKCDICGFKTKRVDNLKRHQREQHLKGGTRRKKKSVHTTEEVETREFVEPLSKLSCGLCSFTTSRKDSLKRHMISLHRATSEIQWYYCESCEFKTKRADNLKRHQQDKHCYNKVAEMVPIKTEPEAEEFIKIETEAVPDEDPLQLTHENGSEPCDNLTAKLDRCQTWVKCNLRPHKNDLIRRHILSFHSKTDKGQRFPCEVCNFKTKRKDLLQRHQKEKHFVTDSKQTVQETAHPHLDLTVLKPRKILPLPRRPEIAKPQPVAPKSDLLSLPKTDEKWFSCDLCPFSAKLERSLKIHQQSHSNKSDNIYFKCAICPLKTTRKDSLRRHIRETHIEWSSEQVMKASESPNALNFPKFYCDKCSYSTEWQKSLGVHYLLKHQNERILKNFLVQQ